MESMNYAPVRLIIIEGPDYRIDDDGWEHNAYSVRLSCGDESMLIPWRQGLGITDDPETTSVLEALLSDAATIENAQSFEDWAAELGYDTDNRKAESIYEAAARQTEELKSLLGKDYDSAVFPQGESVARRLTTDQ
jgi:hypothetical protein